MKKFVFLILCLVPFLGWNQCTTSNTSGCVCDGGGSSCDLLPDITAAYQMLADPSYQPESLGELGVSVSTPNTGHGPLKVLPSDFFVCGTDTIYSPGGLSTCPNPSDEVRQLLQQRIYQKSGGTTSYYDRWAGSMTYHQSHGHFHVDDWGVYTLRIEVPGTDPLTWPIVGDGAKLGFCLMDYGTCSGYSGHCVDDLGGTLMNGDIDNYGLGGGSYSCGLTNQGISVGHTDVYGYWLDGMQIAIPSGTCNGDYKIVVHIDPYDYFLEESEANNVTVADVTLTMQTGSATATISPDGPTELCGSDFVTLTASPGSAYLWSTGETTPSIVVSSGGNYTCDVTTACGVITSNNITVSETPNAAPSATADTTCGPGTVTLAASGTGTLNWYDASSGGTYLASGPSYTTPSISTTTNYYVENELMTVGATTYSPPSSHAGSAYSGSTYNGHIDFEAFSDFTLVSAKVYTDTPGDRIIELRSSGGAVLQSATVTVPSGESRVTVNFAVTPGTYQLGTNGAHNTSTYGDVSPVFQRSSSGISYPYVTSGVVSLNGSPFGASYYYYFYDWEIQEPNEVCTSPRTAVEGYVDYGPGCGVTPTCEVPANIVVSGVTMNTATIDWDVPALGGWKYHLQYKALGGSIGTRFGNSPSFNLTGLGAGLTYLFRARNGCSPTDISGFTYSSFTTNSSKLSQFTNNLSAHPNPASYQVELNMYNWSSGDASLEVHDILGKLIYSENFVAEEGNLQWSLDVSNWAAGMYVATVSTDEQRSVVQFVKE